MFKFNDRPNIVVKISITTHDTLVSDYFLQQQPIASKYNITHKKASGCPIINQIVQRLMRTMIAIAIINL